MTKAIQGFGFKLPLLVGVKHEVSLASTITDTKGARRRSATRSRQLRLRLAG